MSYSIAKGDCLPLMKSLEPASVDCVFVDLPYFEVVGHDWDNQWKDRNEYLDWVVSLAHEWKRITKDNSSIFVFCDEKMEAYIQVRLDEIFLLLNKIVWFKRNNLPQKNAHLLRTFAPMTERALFYTVQKDPTGLELILPFCFVPYMDYMTEQKNKLGWSVNQFNEFLGYKSIASHWFWQNDIKGQQPQPRFISGKDYLRLQSTGYFLKEYEALRQEYEALRQEYEALRRPFNADTKTWDVIEMPIIGGDENTDHPTTKPLGLYRRILSVITNQGQTVLDCCMGSGTAGVVALELGRNFIGFELKDEYYSIAEARIKLAAQSPSFYTLPNNRLHLDVGDSPAQQALFTPEADTAEGKSPTPAPRR